MKDKFILVTGGAGYIGNHTIVQLYQSGYKVIVIDNLCNSSIESIKRVRQIVKHDFVFYNFDLLNISDLRKVFKSHEIESVIHIAGLKAVGESVEKPLTYYNNNITGTINLIDIMNEFSVKSIIFSSSATVYGDPIYLPIDEKHPVGSCTNPYGKTKYFIENILQDVVKSDSQWKAIILRYFNPVGAHKSGLIGEDPTGPPNNLMPYVAQVAIRKRSFLKIFGNDYDTKDGTGVRDYIHIVDLANGHVKALESLQNGCKIYNLGTGSGYSVLEMVKALEDASGQKIDYKFVERRIGDIASCFADPSLARKELNWTAKHYLSDMCIDLWRWQKMNPNGFKAE